MQRNILVINDSILVQQNACFVTTGQFFELWYCKKDLTFIVQDKTKYSPF